jgi:hypothetical protein
MEKALFLRWRSFSEWRMRRASSRSGSSSSRLFSRNSRLSPVRRLTNPAGTDDSSLWLRLRLRRLASELDGTDAGGGSICAILL